MNELVVTCKVIEDLMPLYADGICSEDTKTVVEHHTAECPECRKKLDDMTAELGNKSEKQSPQENPFKKVRRHYAKLVIVTLCICAAVMIPSAVLFRMYINETMDQDGISFSTVTVWNGLRDVGKMLKRGEYLKLLTSAQLYNEDQYTAEEAAVTKKAMAEEMKSFFEKYPIKKIKSEPGLGKTVEGGLQLTLDMGDGTTENCYISCTFDYSTLIGLDGMYSDDSTLISLDGMYSDDIRNTVLLSSLPMLTFIDKGMVEYMVDRLGKISNKIDACGRLMLYFETEEIDSVGEEPGKFAETKQIEIRKVYAKKLYAMLERYSFVGCEGGQAAYAGDWCFRQHAVITMKSEESGEFTAEFDIPRLKYGGFTHLENVSYSDNAPDDFRTMFEEIFVSSEPVWEQYEIPTVNNGKFYLNGNRESCYYLIENGAAQLVLEDEKQARELFELTGYVNFEQYLESTESWREPREFTVVDAFYGTYMAMDVRKDENGYITGMNKIAYIIDSDNIYISNNAVFTRLDDEKE